jgi:hypothetical protein
MRNVAFSILLFALAVVQIAVVSTELPHSHTQAVAANNGDAGARIALVSNQTAHEASAF